MRANLQLFVDLGARTAIATPAVGSVEPIEMAALAEAPVQDYLDFAITSEPIPKVRE